MQSYPELWRAYHDTVVEARRLMGVDIVRRGIAAGEIRSDLAPDLVNDLFVGPMLLRTVLRPDARLDDDLAARVVDALLAGLAPRRDQGQDA